MSRSLLAVALGAPLLAATLPVEAADRLFVSGRDALVAYDLASGRELARFATPGVSADMVVLESGHVLLNHRDGNAIVVVDANTLTEVARFPSSGLGGTRPVHAYLSPALDGRRFLVALNDGVEANTPPGTPASDSTALFVDATPGSPTFLRPVGEVRLGTGHHKMNFAPDRPRAAVSNIGDCQAVLQVLDFADPASIRVVATLSAEGIGLDGRDGRRPCHPRGGEAGVRPAPHGAATDPLTGRGYHNLNNLGAFVSLDMRAETPAFRLLPATRGWGGAAIAAHPTAGLLYAPQYAPREGDSRAPGTACQVGQLAVIDARSDRVAGELPILADGPDCTRNLAGTPEIGARTGYATLAGNTLFLPLGTLAGASHRSHAVAVVDVSTPGEPRQISSIRVGAHNGHRDNALTGDGRFLIVPANVDNVVHVIDTTTREVVRHFPVVAQPNRVAVFGASGPSRPPGPMPAAR
jgi:DNA-binding beta-propeller fold protein YncE